MKWLLAPVGSRGDFQPIFALARGLVRAGHRAIVCGSPDNAAWGASLGLEYHSAGPNFRAWVTERPDALFDLRANLQATVHVVQHYFDAQFAWLEACAEQSGGVDGVLGLGMQLAASSVALRMGVPYLSAVCNPTPLPSAHHAPMLVPWQGLPRAMNRSLWRFGEWGLDRWIRDRLNTKRRSMGLGPVSSVYRSMLGDEVLVACDPELATVPHDVPVRWSQSGAWAINHAPKPLPLALRSFLSWGRPCVYAGFGSMPDPMPARTTELLVRAVRRVGLRLILSRGWAGLGNECNASDVFVVDDLDHRELFSHVAAVMHHGGAGTVATAVRAGVPQIVIPHVVDQHFWARRVEALGLGPKGIRRTSLEEERLVQALQCVLDQPSYRQRSQHLAESLRARRSIEMAVKRLEVLLSPPRNTPRFQEHE